MLLRVLLLLYVLFSANNGHEFDDEIIDYYDNLINEGTNKAFKYQDSTNANSFRGNYDCKDCQVEDFGEYDFVIIGAGSTGCVIAARLSEVTSWKILLIEAGKYENNFTDIPGFHDAYRLSDYNWGYTTVPQQNSCLGMVDNKCAYPRGKAVGGSSVLNGLIYSRGNHKDYDAWQKLTGRGNWSYANVLPYFKKSEHTHMSNDATYHGFNGPLQVNEHSPSSPQKSAFLSANYMQGYAILDFNGKTQFGASPNQLMTVNGRRLSSYKAYLKPIINKTNLHILAETYVTKILFKNKTAYAAEFMHKGNKSVVKASKEIILSAGAVNSPTILMHSGIGPKTILKNAGIGAGIMNLPVGRNLNDHPTFYGLLINTNYTEPVKTRRQLIEEYLRGVGPYTIPANLQGIGYYKTPYASDPDIPDIELLLSTSNSSGDLTMKSFHYTKETYDAVFKKSTPQTSFLLNVVLLRPRSRGHVAIKSNDPFEYPTIDPQFLSDTGDLDMKAMLAGIDIALNLLKTDSFRKLNATLVDYTLPACKGYKYLSEDYWRCTVKHLTKNLHHPMGTCKKARAEYQGVVDGNLIVHGLQNLRVADASIIPHALSGHPQAACVMIGEKISDVIKKKYNHSKK